MQERVVDVTEVVGGEPCGRFFSILRHFRSLCDSVEAHGINAVLQG